MSAVHEYDVIILGGGAAGLMCAIAAGSRGRRVIVLEASNKIGKKISKKEPRTSPVSMDTLQYRYPTARWMPYNKN